MSPKCNKTIFRNYEKRDEILDYIRENINYYSYEELLELIKIRYDFTWSSSTLLVGVLKKYGIKKPKQIPMKTIHIESVFRFIDDIEKKLNAKKNKEEKEEKYAKQIEEKLQRLKRIGEKAEAE